MFRRSVMAAVAALILPCTILGQERAKVAVSFLPPPLETATYSLGIYDAKTHKLVRRLHEYAPATAFTAGLNGLITSWDGKDDDGKPVPPGRYAARGYAIGEMKVEGKAILGNDWASDDEALRISHVQAIALVPDDNGLAIVGTTPLMRVHVARYGGEKCEKLWQKSSGLPFAKVGYPLAGKFSIAVQGDTLVVNADNTREGVYQLADGSSASASNNNVLDNKPSISNGKDSTIWKIEEGVLCQYSSGGERLRSLAPKEGEPVPVAVTASKTTDRLFLLEESKDSQRVRGLSWKESAREGEKTISNWTTFFENSIHPGFIPTGPDNTPLTSQAEIALVENPLSPGKTEHLKITATFDAKGSYLATADGLRLRQISQRPNLRAVKLGKDKAANALDFYQYDGAAWDEFAIEGAKEMMSFDAGEIDLTATGEKAPPKATEPDL